MTTTFAPSALRLLTHPLVYRGEATRAAPFPLAQGVLYNLSGLPVLIRSAQ